MMSPAPFPKDLPPIILEHKDTDKVIVVKRYQDVYFRLYVPYPDEDNCKWKLKTGDYINFVKIDKTEVKNKETYVIFKLSIGIVGKHEIEFKNYTEEEAKFIIDMKK